jgi:hypothetical protein
VTSLFQVAPGDVWAVAPDVSSCGTFQGCRSALLRLGSSGFTPAAEPGEWTSVAGSAPDDVWAATRDGNVRRPDGTPWSLGAGWTTDPQAAGTYQRMLWAEPVVGTFAITSQGSIAQRLR